MSNHAIKDTHETLALNFNLPSGGLEIRTVGTGSVVTFSSSLATGAAYEITTDGGSIYFRTDGTSPSISSGVTNVGIPLVNGATKFFVAGAKDTALKAISSVTGSLVTLVQVASGSSY